MLKNRRDAAAAVEKRQRGLEWNGRRCNSRSQCSAMGNKSSLAIHRPLNLLSYRSPPDSQDLSLSPSYNNVNLPNTKNSINAARLSRNGCKNSSSPQRTRQELKHPCLQCQRILRDSQAPRNRNLSLCPRIRLAPIVC